MKSVPSLLLLVLLSLSVSLSPQTVAAKKQQRSKDLNSLKYRTYPKRTVEEAVVFEWGSNAIISALDASVATFGPQSYQAALIEVECSPVLASPVNGAMKHYGSSSSGDEGSDETGVELSRDGSLAIKALRNADEVYGNIVVMTNNGGLTGVEMARIAKHSGAAALMVVNIDEKRPDDIHRIRPLDEEEEQYAEDIDIPVVMISLNSANILTTATVTPTTEQKDIVNNGMPDRMRLYAGNDRPFFEDVDQASPTLYLIHNLVTDEEADALVEKASDKLTPLATKGGGAVDNLQLNTQPGNYPGVESVMLWQGTLASPAQKAIDDRIEQVTGFPSDHFSDWVVDKVGDGAHWKPHYDQFPSAYHSSPIATIIVFLNELPENGDNNKSGGSIVYPSSSRVPIKILPQKGMAVVHHNMDDKDELEMTTLHAMLPVQGKEALYVARKYVFDQPLSRTRRSVLPGFAFPFGGKLPQMVVDVHDWFVEAFGVEEGSLYFDKFCIFVPSLILLVIAQFLATLLKNYIMNSGEEEVKPKAEKKKSKSSSKKSSSSSRKTKGKSD